MWIYHLYLYDISNLFYLIVKLLIVLLKDVDECKTGPCGTNAFCENTYGSFICNCPKGFRKSGKLNCNGKYFIEILW